MSIDEELRSEVEIRVKWWIEDLAFRPPEMLYGNRGDHYFDCMAKDIAQVAVGDHDFQYSSSRLDPPEPEEGS